MAGQKSTKSSDLTTFANNMAEALTNQSQTVRSKETRLSRDYECATQLSDSEEKFRKIFDESPIGISTADANFHLTQVNKAYCNLVGYTEEELNGTSFLEITHPDDRTKNTELAKKLLSGEISDYSLEKRYIHKSGKIVWVNLKTTLVRDSRGKILYTLGMAEDITERKRSEELLQQSEEKFSQIFHTSPLPIGILRTADNRYIEVNETLAEALKIPREKIIGKTSRELKINTKEEDRKRAQELWEKKGEIDGLDVTYELQNHDAHQASLYVQPFELQGEQCALMMFKDITARKEAEAKLRESEKKFSLVFQASPLPICISQLENGLIIDVNDSLLRLSGYQKDELAGRTSLEAGLYPEPHDREALLRDLTQHKSISGREMRFRAKSGEILQLAMYLEIIELEGKPCLISLFEDITKRKELENRKNEFISIASHELKTPLTSTKAFTQILKQRFKKIGDKPALQYLGKLENQVDKLTDLVNDLLDMTRIEAGKLELHKECFDLESLTVETIEDLQHVTENHQITFEGYITRPVFADRERIGQVLINLITNAVKYSPSKDLVVVQLTSNKNFATVSVQDFGIGIPPEKIDKVFDRFFRSDNRSAPGLGLGLYIASEIIRRHEGTISVKSQCGQGSTFSFSIPFMTRDGKSS